MVFPLLLAVTLCAVGTSTAAEQGQLDASPALFSVLAAINAAGYDADLDSPANHPLRHAVRRELAARAAPSLFDLKRFFAEHRQKTWAAELSQYVSFALSVDGPPSFKYRFLAHQLPPDVQQLDGFAALMRRFHKEADLESLWQKAQPAIEQVLARYQPPAARAVLEVNAYLRSSTTGYLGRRFQIYVDLLGAPHQIHARNYGDDYFLVLTPSPEPQTTDIRRAYLRYLLDPLVYRRSEELKQKKPLEDFALGAPLLAEHYKQDFILLVTACLTRAVEARLEKKPELVEQALREGFILTPYFAEALPAYEKQEQSMRFYFEEIVKGIDLRKETRRLDKVEFASEAAVRKARPTPLPPKPEPTPAEKALEEAEQCYTRRELERASQLYRRLLQETTVRPVQARAYYGLARIAALQKDPETAEKLFQRTLESSPEAPVKAWTHVYLGRLAEAAGEREGSARHFQAALAVEGASEAAREAARKGLAAISPHPGQQR